MRNVRRVAGGVAVSAAVLVALAGSASASVRVQRTDGWWRDAGRAVFVQTDNPAGNAVVAYGERRTGG